MLKNDDDDDDEQLVHGLLQKNELVMISLWYLAREIWKVIAMMQWKQVDDRLNRFNAERRRHSRSARVIDSDTIRQIMYDFMFCNNYLR